MPSILDHLLFLILALLFPIRAGLFGYRKLREAAPEDVPRVRGRLYRGVIITQWSLVVLTLALWLVQSRSVSSLGLVVALGWPFAIGAAGVVLAWFALRLQRRKLDGDPEGLARVRAQLTHIERMLPHSPEERRWFDRVSMTAGVCEEVLYRGFMMWYLEHWVGPIAAMFAAAVVFGWSHVYQGVRGTLTTGVAGLLLGALYLATGSLFVGMTLHAIIDSHSGHLAYRVFEHESRARELAPT